MLEWEPTEAVLGEEKVIFVADRVWNSLLARAQALIELVGDFGVGSYLIHILLVNSITSEFIHSSYCEISVNNGV